MENLTTKYLGLNLKSPIIAGSCGLTNSIDNLLEIEKQGAGAIVLKSIFEEQILHEFNKDYSKVENDYYHEAYDSIKNYFEINKLGVHLQLIKDAKEKVKIPIIASINCTSNGEWVSFAKEIQNIGADALELNISILPSDKNITSEEYENKYIEIIEKIKQYITIPIAVKTGVHFSSIVNMMHKFSWSGVNGLVLFNRFYSPDIDLKNMKMSANNIFSNSEEYSIPLRWIGILSDEIKCDLCASTGIYNGETVIKQILAGASAVQISSVMYKNGFGVISEMNNDISNWMKDNRYNSINDFKSKMNYKNIPNPQNYNRIQFMKYFAGIE